MAAPTSFAPGVARDARERGSWTEANGRDGSVRSVPKEDWRLQDAGFAVLVGFFLHAMFRTWEAAPLLFLLHGMESSNQESFCWWGVWALRKDQETLHCMSRSWATTGPTEVLWMLIHSHQTPAIY
jgi:hypothetical protein